MPWNVSSVVENKTIPVPYSISGLTTTSQGDLVAISKLGPDAAIYSFDLVHILDLNVVGAVKLWDATRKDNVLFITETSTGNVGIHVVNETGEYSHNIYLSWSPRGIDIDGNVLFVTANAEDAVYKIELNDSNQATSIVKIMSSPGAFDNPTYLHIRNNSMVVSNFGSDSITMANLNGQVVWGYGSSGSGDGRFNTPTGLSVDNWGRTIVADRLNSRVQLISPSGSFIMYLMSGMGGRVQTLLLKGNTVIVAQMKTHKLNRFDIY